MTLTLRSRHSPLSRVSNSRLGPIGGSDHPKPNVTYKLFATPDRLQMAEFLFIDSRYFLAFFRASFEQSFGDLQGQRFNSHFSQIIGGKALRAVKF